MSTYVLFICNTHANIAIHAKSSGQFVLAAFEICSFSVMGYVLALNQTINELFVLNHVGLSLWDEVFYYKHSQW